MYYEKPMAGSLRITNPRTLQKWISKGWYKKEIDRGYVFNPCGRFRPEKCTCSKCRKSVNSPLMKVIKTFYEAN